MGSVTVSNLGKAYRQYTTRWSRLAEWLVPWHGPRHTRHWALQNINFRISPGEAVGVIGSNGAGKSTLLKLITGTIQPTTGAVQVEGRMAALLELGMGFHPDFTGRQNVYMASQLLGLRSHEIASLMPEIEAFAEIGKYIDQPVRVYSSGMIARLAFSVATSVRPDILIIDEVLSVGDAYFQHKSFARIREFGEQGTTRFIVSHSKESILAICDRAILLEGGCLIKEGSPEEVVDFYNAMIAERENSTIKQSQTETGQVQTLSGTGEARVIDIALLDEGGSPVEVIDVGASVTLQVRVRTYAKIPGLVLGYAIRDRLGQAIFGTNTFLRERPLLDVPAGEEIEYRFRFPANLGPGSYSISTALHEGRTHLMRNYEWRDLALIFQVANLTRTEFTGCNWMEPQITTERRHDR